MILDPEADGITHINVYSKGKTEAGRFMSNFAYTPFHHPKYGYFASVEALWYWLSCKNDALRPLHGFAAKKLGRELRAPDWVEDFNFKHDIKTGILAKLEANPEGAKLVSNTKLTLPLVHYYNMRGKVTDLTEKSLWMLAIYDRYRMGNAR